MEYLRAALATIFVILVGLAGFIFFTYDHNYELNNALELYLKGENSQAEAVLKKLEPSLPSSQYNLYQGYIARANRKMELSNSYLEKAEKGFDGLPSDPLLLEIYLNQAFNGYLQDKVNLVYTPIKMASKTWGYEQEWVAFFLGIEYYMNWKYSDALKQWQGRPVRASLSPWMQKSFDETFTPLWEKLHIARCNIEEGRYLVARDMLEGLAKESNTQDANDIHFLIGLSYAKEAEQQPANTSVSYYKMAFSQFSLIPIQSERYAKEREKIIVSINSKAIGLIDSQNLESLPYYIGILENWHAQNELANIASHLADLVRKELNSNDPNEAQDLANVLNRLLPEGEARQSVRSIFENELDQALAADNIPDTKKYWESARLFSLNPGKLKQRVIQAIEAKIIAVIPGDKDSLSKTAALMNFWNQTQTNPQARLSFESRIIGVALQQWEQGNAPKALALLKMVSADATQNEKQTINAQIAETVSKIYSWASQQDKIDELPFIMKAVQDLHLSNLKFNDHEHVAQLLEEAKEGIAEKNYQESFKKANWLLTIEPQNEQAIRYSALALYHLNSYTRALPYLKEIKDPGIDIQEALAISQILGGEPVQGQALLDKILNKQPLKKETILRLAYGSLINNKPKEALSWLDAINSPDNEVEIGKLYAYDELQEWQQAIDQYQKIKPPYNKLEAVQGMAIAANLALGKQDVAEKMINELLEQTVQPDTKSFSGAYQDYKSTKIGSINRYYTAALFYFKYRKDDQKALAYLNKIENPSAEVLIHKSQVQLSLGQTNDALKNLTKALTLSRDLPNEDELRKAILPMLASAFEAKKEYPEAISYFQEYFSIEPNPDSSYRTKYANALMHMHRYDLAADQIVKLGEQEQSLNDKLALLESLVHTGSFAEANQIANELLEKEPNLSTIQRLQIARWMVNTQNYPLVSSIVASLPPPNQRSLNDNIAWLRLLTQVGEYAKAKELADTIYPQTGKSADGLLSIAELYAKVGDTDEAIKIAGAATKLEPQNEQIAQFIQSYQHSPEILSKKIQELQKKLMAGESTTQIKLQYAHDLIDQALEIKLSNEPKDMKDSVELQKADAVLESISNDSREIPEAYFLQGQVQFLLDENAKAAESYQRAIKLDPSYVEAYKYLALLQTHMGQSSEAVQSLKKAVTFAPNDVEAWYQLGRLYQKEGNTIDAVNAWEHVIKYAPNDDSAYIPLAKLQLELNEPLKAKQTLGKALIIKPGNVSALKLLLITLYDPNLKLDGNGAKLEEARKQVYNRLKELDAHQADALLLEITGKKE